MLLVVTAVCWTAMAVTALVTLYARSLSPHETWMWEQALRVILYYGVGRPRDPLPGTSQN